MRFTTEIQSPRLPSPPILPAIKKALIENHKNARAHATSLIGVRDDGKLVVFNISKFLATSNKLKTDIDRAAKEFDVESASTVLFQRLKELIDLRGEFQEEYTLFQQDHCRLMDLIKEFSKPKVYEPRTVMTTLMDYGRPSNLSFPLYFSIHDHVSLNACGSCSQHDNGYGRLQGALFGLTSEGAARFMREVVVPQKVNYCRREERNTQFSTVQTSALYDITQNAIEAMDDVYVDHQYATTLQALLEAKSYKQHKSLSLVSEETQTQPPIVDGNVYLFSTDLTFPSLLAADTRPSLFNKADSEVQAVTPLYKHVRFINLPFAHNFNEDQRLTLAYAYFPPKDIDLINRNVLLVLPGANISIAFCSVQFIESLRDRGFTVVLKDRRYEGLSSKLHNASMQKDSKNPSFTLAASGFDGILLMHSLGISRYSVFTHCMGNAEFIAGLYYSTRILIPQLFPISHFVAMAAAVGEAAVVSPAVKTVHSMFSLVQPYVTHSPSDLRKQMNSLSPWYSVYRPLSTFLPSHPLWDDMLLSLGRKVTNFVKRLPESLQKPLYSYLHPAIPSIKDQKTTVERINHAEIPARNVLNMQALLHKESKSLLEKLESVRQKFDAHGVVSAVLHPTNDLLLTYHASANFARQLGDSTSLHVINGAGHLTAVGGSDYAVDVIVGLLASTILPSSAVQKK